jgi:hypothetical protein
MAKQFASAVSARGFEADAPFCAAPATEAQPRSKETANTPDALLNTHLTSSFNDRLIGDDTSLCTGPPMPSFSAEL